MGLERLSAAISVVPSLRALEEAVRPTWEKVPPSKYGPNLFRQTANKKDPERGALKDPERGALKGQDCNLRREGAVLGWQARAKAPGTAARSSSYARRKAAGTGTMAAP